MGDAATDPPTRAAYVDSASDQKSTFGDGDNISVTYDRAEEAIVFRDEITGTDLTRLPLAGNVFEVLEGLQTGPLSMAQDGGEIVLADMPVSSAPSQGTAQSYALQISGTKIATIYAEADGSGGIQNPVFKFPQGAESPGSGTIGKVFASGSVTGTGGAGEPGPAADVTLTNVAPNEGTRFEIRVAVDAPQDPADYAWNPEVSKQWNSSQSQWDANLVINWDNDPGSNNDVDFLWESVEV